MSSPSHEWQILQALQGVLNAVDATIELMPAEPGQDNKNLPALQIFPEDTERLTDTSRWYRFRFMVTVLAVVSQEEREATVALFELQRAGTSVVMAQRATMLGLDFVTDLQLLGGGDPLAIYPGVLTTQARATWFAVDYQVTHDQLIA